MDQTGWSSILFSVRDRSNEGNAFLGPTEHQAMVSLPAYARMPGTSPESIMVLRRCFFSWPVCLPKSERDSLHHMHQQLPYAPFSPNNVCRSCQRSGITG